MNDSLESVLAPLLAELIELKAWKESAMFVLENIDLQAAGKQLGLRLGSDIGPNILPAIKRLQAENTELRELLRLAENALSAAAGFTYDAKFTNAVMAFDRVKQAFTR